MPSLGPRTILSPRVVRCSPPGGEAWGLQARQFPDRGSKATAVESRRVRVPTPPRPLPYLGLRGIPAPCVRDAAQTRARAHAQHTRRGNLGCLPRAALAASWPLPFQSPASSRWGAGFGNPRRPFWGLQFRSDTLFLFASLYQRTEGSILPGVAGVLLGIWFPEVTPSWLVQKAL